MSRDEGLADVCLVLEGTYPFVRGGVSSWVHTLVTSMPELTFTILHVSPRPGFHRRPVYELPANVRGVDECHLVPAPVRGGRGLRRRTLRQAIGFVQALAEADPTALDLLLPILPELRAAPAATRELLASPEAWQALLEQHGATAQREGFRDFFWNWHFVHQPLFGVLTTKIPAARCYHAVCTGYAGLLAAIARLERAAPMILTEHGLYARERRIEIQAAEWIHDPPERDVAPAPAAPALRALWDRHFRALGLLAYRHADPILTLSRGNRTTQIQDGAPPAVTRIVPNGIDLERFAAAAAMVAARGADAPFTVGFAGRITPIKDLRTFLQAMRLLRDEVPGLRVEIMGPMEEDPLYAADCRAFAHDLGLDDCVAFLGQTDLAVAFGRIDVLVLTSISEAQPLVILEAGAASVPVLATDVGDCREMLLGEAAGIGPGGAVMPIASPGVCARLLRELHADPARRRRLGQDLQERVRRCHDRTAMIEAYRGIYASAVQEAAV